MNKRTIFLIRHGTMEMKDGLRRYVGQLDLPLSQEGTPLNSKTYSVC